MKIKNNKVINVLLVEDNKEQALIIKLILENNNCKVKIISEGLKAINFLNTVNIKPELVFLDYYLPDMTGLDIIAQINNKNINVGIIFLTSSSDINIAFEAIRMGAIDFITKSDQLADHLTVGLQKAYIIYNERLKKIELENQVIEKEKIFYKTITSAPWGMHFYKLRKDEKLVFIGANPAADSILEIEHHNLIGKTIDEVFPVFFKSKAPAEYKNIAEKGGVWQTKHINFKNEEIGGVFEIIVYQPSSRQVVAIFREITEKYKHEQQIKLKNAEIEQKNKRIEKQFNDYVLLIDELKKTNEELAKTKEKIEESERNYHEMFDSTSDALIIHDSLTGKIVDVNKTTLKMFGYDDKEEILAGNVDDISAAEEEFSEERAQAIMHKTKKSEINTFEWHAKKKNGEPFWVEVSLKKNIISGVERIMASIRDISARKKSEEALRHSQEMLKNVMGHFPDLVFWKDLQSVYIGCNQFFAYAAGFENPNDIIGKTDYDLPWTKAEADSYRRDDRQVIEKGESKLHIIEAQHRSDGKVVWLDTNKVPLCDDKGNIIGVIGTSSDITDRKLTEDALQDSKHLFKTLTEVSPVGIFRTDIYGNTTYVNPKWLELTGLSIEKSMGYGWLDAVHPEDKERISQNWKSDSFSKNNSVAEYRFIKPDGSIVWVIGNAVPAWNENEITGFIGTITDITERKQHEMQLKTKNEEIEIIYQEINAQNEEMRAQNDELTKNFRKINLLNKIIKDREKILQSLINTANIGIAIINKEGRFVLFNKYIQEILGYKKTEMYQITYLSITYKEDKTAITESVNQLYNSIKDTQHIETRLIKKDNNFFWAEQMLSSIKDDDGNTEMIVCVIQDISIRKEFEDLLKKNELQFRSIWTNSIDGMRLTDENGICILVNEAYCKMVGMEKSKLEGYLYPIIYSATDQTKQVESFVERFRKRKIEIQHRKKVTLWNKENRWFDISNAFILEETNSPLLLSIFRDETEQQLAKEAYDEKQRQINTLISNLPGIAYRCRNDKDWTMEYIKGECKQLTGYDAEDLLFNKNLSFNDIINPEYQEILWEKWQKNLAEKVKFEYEYTITTANGEIKWVWERGRGIYDENGDVLALEGFITDITERKKAALEIIEAESKYRSIFESAYEGIFQSTPDGKFITINPAFVKMFGYDNPGEMLDPGYDINTMLFVDPKKREEFLEIIKEHSFFKGFEYQAKKKDGTIIWVYEDVRAVKDSDGKILYFEGFCIDTTKQKQAEELAIQKEIAENTAKFKQQFLANMSHEMRTPMNGIIGMVDFLLKTKLDETQLSYATTIKESSDTLLNIINNTLDLSRLEAGKITMHPNIFNIHEISRKTRQLFNALVKQKEIKFIVNYTNVLNEFIKGDEYRVCQIINNFLSNSIKYTEKGSITLNYHQSQQDEKVLMKIEIIDTGIGISKDNQKHLFNKFSQIDSSKTRHFDGAGLGLSICKELAVMMGGNVGLSSKPGKGSCFWFTFLSDPVSEKEIEHFNKDKDLETNCFFGLNILIVEDKAVNSKILSLMLKNMGCHSEVATNGIEALKIFEENKYEIILMDIQMPLMDGVTAVKELKKKYNNLPPIIALTADAMEGDAEFYISQGMDDYLAKPVLYESLYQKIRKWYTKMDG